ncbi:MAG: prephenate dehydrogenase/arogenate dehydrogenase family protein, partial [Stackebrandtia sp.]
MRVGVVGLGLIGGSLSRALRHAGHDVRGADFDARTRGLAADAGFDVVDDPRALVDADVVFLAVPLPALPAVLPTFADFRGLLTDVTSVKARVAALVAQCCSGVRFVGGHPMAGKETSGFEAGEAGLFRDRTWVLCLDDDTRLEDWRSAARLVCGLGARAVAAVSSEHDAAAARISHLPHLLAAAMT